MDKNKIVKVTNRDTGVVGYSVPELGIRRQFQARETKELEFNELERLSFMPGGARLLKEYLIVKDEEAIKALFPDIEPEYFYGAEEIKKVMTEGSLNEFLDMLDFAPDGVLDMVKDLAVSLPLNDVRKRDAILEKLNFNVSGAINIQNTKFDDGSEDTSNEVKKTARRVATPAVNPGRRTETPEYKVVSKK